jgi:flavin reductase (DIM6/NTAB) family NADH-FMN oxidoreductase RutF
VSFTPRLVAVTLERDSSTFRRIQASGCFSVNLLTAEPDSLRMAMQFVQPADASKVEGRSDSASAQHHSKLEGIEHTRTARGLPLLDDALMWLECDLEQVSEAGDHVLVLGRVVDGRVVNSAEPMTTMYTWVSAGDRRRRALVRAANEALRRLQPRGLQAMERCLSAGPRSGVRASGLGCGPRA